MVGTWQGIVVDFPLRFKGDKKRSQLSSDAVLRIFHGNRPPEPQREGEEDDAQEELPERKLKPPSLWPGFIFSLPALRLLNFLPHLSAGEERTFVLP